MLIPIAELWPTEGVLREEKVAELVADLTAGKELKAINCFVVEGRTLVRDGDNRVRAWIQYYLRIGK